jgi:parallel beta-helix repeat protein
MLALLICCLMVQSGGGGGVGGGGGDGAALPTITVDRDNIEIAESCRVRIAAAHIPDADGNGVIRIAGDGIEVEFLDSPLHGAAPDEPADAFTGTGIRITGRDVTVRGAIVSGYKVGIHAVDATGLTIHHCDVSGNFRQRLGSTPQREDSADWLWPHANDDNEWMTNYGAGLCIEDSNNVTVHDIRGRAGQNGIILDRVNDSKVFDNDCSFLSGWGLAMWRSSRNAITRNAFDFCIRGYSHGVYNRGQDSAGILMFEQCDDNLIAENSATHSGDGFFAFAGKEALGENDAAAARDVEWFRGRGHTGNRLINNDFSYAAAHGIELTFSFDNAIHSNRLVGNAICGIWGGYSQRTDIAGNAIEDNGEGAYGLERGGVNIEHGRDNIIRHNTFANNKCGIHLWWDEDAALMATPWAKVNGPDSVDALINDNTFAGDAVGIQLRRTKGTRLSGNTVERVANPVTAEDSEVERVTLVAAPFETPPYGALGETRPVGARAHLRGREHIIMGEWGPYDWAAPLLQFIKADRPAGAGPRLEYRVLGSAAAPEIRVTAAHPVESRITPFANTRTGEVEKVRIAIGQSLDAPGDLAGEGGRVWLLNVEWRFAGQPWQSERREVTDAMWRVKHFASPVDPREDVDAWHAAADRTDAVARTAALDLPFGNGGPEGLGRSDHFGTIATTEIAFPPGRWRLRTTSDDGIRVWVNDELVIDDWTWHGPTEHSHDFEVGDPRTITIRVEHFELDGYAVLKLDIEPGP